MRGRSKYGAKKAVVDGITFDSMKEAKRYKCLKEEELAGRIKNLRLQVPFIIFPAQYEVQERYHKRTGERLADKYALLERPVNYIADFVYEDCETGKEIVEDTKGMRTPDYIIKRKAMLYLHGIRIKEV